MTLGSADIMTLNGEKKARVNLRGLVLIMEYRRAERGNNALQEKDATEQKACQMACCEA